MQVQVGDRVAMSNYAETLTLGSDEWVLIRESEILAIVREE